MAEGTDDFGRNRQVIAGFDPIFIALLKRSASMGGLAVDLRRSNGDTSTARFPATTAARLSEVVNRSPQGVLDPVFLGEVSDVIVSSFEYKEGF